MRYELTDHEWAAIKPMLPSKPRGVARVNDRRVLNGTRVGLGAERALATELRQSLCFARLSSAPLAMTRGRNS